MQNTDSFDKGGGHAILDGNYLLSRMMYTDTSFKMWILSLKKRDFFYIQCKDKVG